MGANTVHIFLIEKNPLWDLTINNLDLAAYADHLHIFAPLMNPLYHIATKVENTAAEVWSKRGSSISSTAVSTLFREI